MIRPAHNNTTFHLIGSIGCIGASLPFFHDGSWLLGGCIMCLGVYALAYAIRSYFEIRRARLEGRLIDCPTCNCARGCPTCEGAGEVWR